MCLPRKLNLHRFFSIKETVIWANVYLCQVGHCNDSDTIMNVDTCHDLCIYYCLENDFNNQNCSVINKSKLNSIKDAKHLINCCYVFANSAYQTVSFCRAFYFIIQSICRIYHGRSQNNQRINMASGVFRRYFLLSAYNSPIFHTACVCVEGGTSFRLIWGNDKYTTRGGYRPPCNSCILWELHDNHVWKIWQPAIIK